MNEIQLLLAELRKFSPEIAAFNGPADPALIAAFELDNQLILPEDYKRTIEQINGFSIMGDEVYGILGKEITLSLENIYYREHFQVHLPQYPYIVPFMPDGRGNFYCFDTRYRTQNGTSCSVIFWVSNYEYTDEDVPEVVNVSFVDFMNEVIINSILEEYNYQGEER